MAGRTIGHGVSVGRAIDRHEDGAVEIGGLRVRDKRIRDVRAGRRVEALVGLEDGGRRGKPSICPEGDRARMLVRGIAPVRDNYNLWCEIANEISRRTRVGAVMV